MKRSHVGKLTIAIVYVDDIIVKWDDYEEIKRLKKKLSKDFMIKDLRRLKCFLGIEMAHSRRDIFISYQKYILDLFKEISMLGCKPVDTPIEQNHELEKTWEYVVIECGMWNVSTSNWEVNRLITHKAKYSLCCQYHKPIYGFS